MVNGSLRAVFWRSIAMRRLRLLLLLGLPALVLASDAVLSFPEPKNHPPDKDTLAKIAQQTRKLSTALDILRRQGVRDPALTDIEIYLKAAQWIVKHNEFYHKDAGKWTLGVLDRGLLRANQQARGETPWLGQLGQSVVRGYRSRVDGSVQPYAVTYPHDYATTKRKRYRL